MAEITIKSIDETRFQAKLMPTSEEVEAATKEAVTRVRSRKKLHGFRKGKAPDHVVQSKFSGEIQQEKLNHLLQDIIPDIDKKTDHALYEIVKVENIKEGSNKMSIDLIYDCMPYVNLCKLKEAVLKEHIAIIQESDVNVEIENQRRRLAKLMEKDNQQAEKGDHITLDYEVWVNDIPHGEPVRGHSFVLGEDGFDQEVEALILEKSPKVGEEIIIKKKTSSEHEGEKSDIQELEFIVTITKVQVFDLPAIDDDFAKMVDDKFSTVNELRADTRVNLGKHFSRQNIKQEINNAVDIYLTKSQVFFPESFINAKKKEFIEERKIDMQSLDKEVQQSIHDAIIERERRSVIINHLIKLSHGGATKTYRQRFLDFVEKDFGESARSIMGEVYDRMTSKENLTDSTMELMNVYLQLFQTSTLESFFRSRKLIKKGKKIDFADFISNQSKK